MAKEELVVALKNQPVGPPTVWFVYWVAGGAAAAAAVAVMAMRITMTVGFAMADLMALVWPLRSAFEGF